MQARRRGNVLVVRAEAINHSGARLVQAAHLDRRPGLAELQHSLVDMRTDGDEPPFVPARIRDTLPAWI